MKELIDTHIHCWNFERSEYEWLKNDTSILNRSYHIDEIEQERVSSGITGGVLVQSANTIEDSDWMLEVAENNLWIKGVVGWLPLMKPLEAEKIFSEKFSHNKYFKGIRHLIHDEPDDRWLLQESVIESLRMIEKNKLSYDIVGVLPSHINTALEVADKIPGLRMVFDHLNQPPISSKEKFGRWGELMKEASGNNNFYAKISGLGTTAKDPSWIADDLKPYIEFVLEHFGVDRCFCGGDWPVSLLAGSYSKTWSIYKEVINSLVDPGSQEKIYYTNAFQFYDI
jgi:L-fuconolactonase